MIQMEVIDPVLTRIERAGIPYVGPSLTFESEYWHDSQFGKKRVAYTADMFIHKGSRWWTFPTGLLPKVTAQLERNKIEFQLNVPTDNFIKKVVPSLRKTNEVNFDNFKSFQLKALDQIFNHSRGVLKAATGTGKTIIQLGAMSMFPDSNILLLAHTASIVKQTFDIMKKFRFPNVTQLGAGEKIPSKLKPGITIATRQAFARVPWQSYYGTLFDMVIIDEVHHVNKLDCQYGRILMALRAPLRYGFTATLPATAEGLMSMEGLVGPLIYEFGIQEAVESDSLTEPRVMIVRTPYNGDIKQIRLYPEAYKRGIIQNRARNFMIYRMVKYFLEEKQRTVMILTTSLEHGELLQSYIERIAEVAYVQGSTALDEREEVKQKVNAGRLKCVIATNAWKEGVDIPNVDVVINASGGKSEIATLQLIGRGLRKAAGKEYTIVVDFFDPSNRFFVDHFGHRLSLYMENKWRFHSDEDLPISASDIEKQPLITRP